MSQNRNIGSRAFIGDSRRYPGLISEDIYPAQKSSQRWLYASAPQAPRTRPKQKRSQSFRPDPVADDDGPHASPVNQ